MRGLAALSMLVVDDNPHMRTLVLSLLRGFGFEAMFQADNVADAWRQFVQRRFDIVVVDLALSGASGADLIERIRRDQHSPAPQTAIILMTAHTDKERVLRARDAGASEIIAKPISAGGLFARIAAVIDHPRAFIRSLDYVGPDRRRRSDEHYSGPLRRETDNDFLELDGPIAA